MSSTQAASSQLHLVRFSCPSKDRAQFLFAMPSNLLQGFIKELNSTTFEFPNRGLRLKFVRSSVDIGVYLELIVHNNTSLKRFPGEISICLDIAVTIINLEHFSNNQTFTNVKFYSVDATLWEVAVVW